MRENIYTSLIILGIVIGICLGITYILPIAIPFLIALLIGKLIHPIAKTIEEKVKIKRGIVTAIVIIISIIILMVILRLILLQILPQVEKFIGYFPFYREKVNEMFCNGCTIIDNGLNLTAGQTLLYFSENASSWGGNFTEKMFSFITTLSKQTFANTFSLLVAVMIMITSTIYFVRDYEKIKEALKKTTLFDYINEFYCNIIKVLGVYIKAQFIIMFFNIIICGIGLFLAQNSYYILIAIIIGVIDALPILGAGTIIIPYGIYYMITGDFTKVLIFVAMYVACIFVRQIVEPRVIGKQIGVTPLVTIIMMYAGYKVFGVLGFILGPMGFMIGKQIYMCIMTNLKDVHCKS